MFMLLLFFMLGADFGRREQEPLTLPQARAITDCTKYLRGRALTINAHHRDDRACSGPCRIEEHWLLTVNGRDCTDPMTLRGTIAVESAGLQRGPIQERRIILRADAGAPVWLPQRALNACAALGFQRVHIASTYPRL
jgi:biopolymer transport protein ExbD